MYIATTGGHQVPTNSIEERDPLPVFYKRKVQFLLKSMTGLDLAKVFSQRLVPDYSMPKFVLVTDEELIQVYVIFIGLALWCLMPLSKIFQVYQWQSVLLVEETGVHTEITTDLPQVTDKLYHIMMFREHLV